MKVSLSKFYKEVTGKETGNRATVAPALARWGVPFDNSNAKTDAVDIVHLDSARKVWAAEVAAKEAAKAARPAVATVAEPNTTPAGALTAALVANTNAQRDLESAIMLLVEHLGALDTGEPT